MAAQHFEQVVDDYLSNSISPGNLVWLRSEISLDDECRNMFLKKCRQHQATQYFMVQQTLPADWGGIVDEDLPEYSESERESKSSQATEEGDGLAQTRPPSFRSLIEYGLISGLACLTIVLGVSWLDRHRLFLDGTHAEGGATGPPAYPKPEFAANAYHSRPNGLVSQELVSENEEEGSSSYLSAQQLRWFLRLDELQPDGKWADEPTDYGIDFEKLDRLHRRSQFRAVDFPHSMLHPDFLLETRSSMPDGEEH